ncbi:MAG TPA: hypothetical protein VIG57_00435 [Candidatus Entotheonella sp.]|jgi:hypothetical protein
MSLEAVSHHYGTYFSELSHPERRAVIRYIDKLSQRYPDLAAKATAGPGNEGTVYVYAPVPAEDDQNIAIYEASADVAIDILLDTGVSIALMPGPE